MQSDSARTGIVAASLFGLIYGLLLALNVLHFSARPYSASDTATLLLEFAVLLCGGAAALATLLTWPCVRLARARGERAVVFGTAFIIYLGSTIPAGQIMAMYWVKHPEIETFGQAVFHQTLKITAVVAVGLVLSAALATAARIAARHWIAVPLIALGLAFAASRGLTARAELAGYERPGESVPAMPLPDRPRKVFLFGIDAIDVKWVEKFMAEGRMPYFSRIWERSSRGALRTLELSDTPRVWTTIQTGMYPRRHGVVSHLRWSFPGVSEQVSMPTRRKLNFLFDLLARTTGLVQQHPVVHDDARVRKLWQIASEAGLRTTVISYYGTRPVFPLRGTVLSHGSGRDLRVLAEGRDRLAPKQAPSLIYSDIEGFSIEPPDVTGAPLWSVATLREVMKAEQPDLLGLYISVNDAPGHKKIQYYMPELFFDVDTEGIAAYGEDYPHSFNVLDDLIEQIMEQVPDDYLTIVVSDHGMEPVMGEQGHYGGHAEQIDGIFVAWGPGVFPGQAPEMSVVDVVPTVLALLGLPPAQDMDGRPVLGFLEKSHRPPVSAPIVSYDAAGPPVAPIGEVGDDQLLEQLRSLGYVE